MKAAQLGKAGCTKDWLTQESGVEATHALSAALLKAELLRRQSYSTGLTLPAPKELSSILKIETVQDASKDEIAHLWNEVSTGTWI